MLEELGEFREFGLLSPGAGLRDASLCAEAESKLFSAQKLKRYIRSKAKVTSFISTGPFFSSEFPHDMRANKLSRLGVSLEGLGPGPVNEG